MTYVPKNWLSIYLTICLIISDCISTLSTFLFVKYFAPKDSLSLFPPPCFSPSCFSTLGKTWLMSTLSYSGQNLKVFSNELMRCSKGKHLQTICSQREFKWQRGTIRLYVCEQIFFLLGLLKAFEVSLKFNYWVHSYIIIEGQGVIWILSVCFA